MMYELLETYKGIDITLMSVPLGNKIISQISFQYCGDEIIAESVEDAKKQIDELF